LFHGLVFVKATYNFYFLYWFWLYYRENNNIKNFKQNFGILKLTA